MALKANALDSIRNKHRGRSAVVMGAGPSLRFVDGPGIKRHIMIAVNDAMNKHPGSDYYLTCDVAMTRYWHWDVLKRASCPILAPADSFKPAPGVTLLAGIPLDRYILFPRRRGAFRTHVSDHALIAGPSSANTAVNAAVVMGCSPIYLVGCDCRCEKGRKYYWEFKGQGRGGTKDGFPTRCLSEMKRVGRKLASKFYDPWFKRDGDTSHWTFEGWKKQRDLNPDVKIIDASGLEKGGALSALFPTIDMRKLLQD